MNIVFFGTSEFAILSLRALLETPHKILAVVTQPDRQKGRALKVAPPLTKVLAETHDINVYQPVNASAPEAVKFLKGLNADLFVVVSFGQILSKDIISIPRLYSINLHASLLPIYRGAAPTNWAIINGDETTGVTVMKMSERMDEGDIILKKEVGIGEEDTNITLSEKLSDLGAKALLEAMELIEFDSVNFIKQDASKATCAPKLRKEDGLINWTEPAAKIHNKVRGLIPWPGAYTALDGKILKIWKTQTAASPSASDAKSGEVVAIAPKSGIVVKTGAGNIAITHLQLEGKKILDSDAFLRGHRLSLGHRFIG